MDKKVFIIILILTFTTACQFFEYNDSATEIIIRSERFTLAWDNNEITIPNESSSIKCYKIYYKFHNATTWTFLKNTPDGKTVEISISKDILDYGIYDFGVAAQYNDDSISELHSSLDKSADPITGWYLNWIGSQ